LSRVPRTFAIGASVLAAATGLAFGLFLPSVGHAQEPPPTTVSTPTVPTPDPAPPKTTPKPAPKAAPKPAPRRTTPRSYSRPTYQPPRRQSVAPRSTPKQKARAPKKKVKKAPVKQTTTVLPKVSVTPPIGVVGVRNAFRTKSVGGSFDLGSLVIVLGLGLAIGCFAVALVPAAHVKWRPVAIFVSERQLDLTIIGLALLMGALFTFLWTKG
jgi:hypothetical protein